MMTRTFSTLLVVLALVQGCASTSSKPSVDNVEQYFLDQHFVQTEAIAPTALFHLPSLATQQLRVEFSKSRMSRNYMLANQWLADYINADNGGFLYQDNMTRVAADTYGDRAGNCLSLVLLTAAMADALDVDVEFQEIEVPPIWDKQGDFYLVNGHINLRLIPKETNDTFHVSKQAIQVDFLPERSVRGYAKKQIDKATVMAMFYNNVAAESLVVGDFDKAYSHIKQSLQLKADFVPALNTLAILYRYKGLDDAAETVYKLALGQDGEDMNALFNYAVLLSSQNRLEEWAEVHKTLELARIRNPYYYYDMAQQAYFDRQYDEALTWYKRAVEKANYRHEFYFGLSRAYWATGDEDKAKRNLEKALALSGDEHNKQRYQAKLHAMKTH
ncbi:lipopolysaccharide assembly protein LapB [Shewanella colwelliana]|uniref:Uncharacterized protein n=1 Tax=Shewanella colwelliana TaxID=23 RepID=A0A1E5IPY5_SHECO|nr:tetratricopeptide repeat protein [Shewanella colwelliana]MDX1279738.1 tetratricopeptide repeat protein [Shewanella colwelliana]OEG72609.1 hypothetical protein BEL05_10010 [Shewanella colwelliana]GIU45510.1 hypothetical protein TUM3794_35980 [Shewanella colwelliana]